MQMRKRPRQPMRRTTSMKEIAFAPQTELPRPSNPEAADDRQSGHALLLQQQRNQRRTAQVDAAPAQYKAGNRPTGADWLDVGFYVGSLAPSGGVVGGRRRRNSGEFAVPPTAPFLMACGLCKRRLGPGRDTFMYRGETAFCSLDCRQQHMNQVELKCSLTSIKETPQATNCSEKSDNGETVAAA